MMQARIKNDMEIEQFRCLQAKIDEIVLQKQKQEVDFGDIPDEFKGENKQVCLNILP